MDKNIRERTGSFFTPKIWADKSKEYLADVFGDNWQDEYYIWDCAAGTGNLLAGLSNKYNIWASDIEASYVETMQSLIDIDENLNLLPAHVFRFDFLNDEFDKVPEGLREIINDEEKRKKLIMYINPPYAEHGNKYTLEGRGKHKSGVSVSQTKNRFKYALGSASRELYAMFFMRIFQDLHGAKLASFCKLKIINAQNFENFRKVFNPKFNTGFICPAHTFDNVMGKFPIGFLIWNTKETENIENIICDTFNSSGENIGRKRFFFYTGQQKITKYERMICSDNGKKIGCFHLGRHDFQNVKLVFIETIQTSDNFVGNITINNFLQICICLSVQHCITPTWLNDRDQYLFPNDGWETDIEFHCDCLIFALFHGQNRISCNDGVNHWIPFTEKEVGAKDHFDSHFMSDFIKDKTFSDEAQSVLAAALELWKYYHEKIKNNRQAPVNASFYDIREFFQGRNDAGKMNNKSNDESYNALIKTLREKLDALAKKIEPKVYEYGFLKE